MNDTELLRRYSEEGSQEAFAELVRLRIGLVYAAALRQTGGDIHRAQDVAQAVFTTLARKAASLCRHSSLIGWLYTTTRFTADAMARSERRRRVREQEAHMMREDLSAPALEILGEHFRPLLDDAMHHLSETDRRAILLRFFDGCSMAELSRSLGTSEPAAKMRVDRALGKLRNLLAKRGLASTAAAVGAALSQEAAASTVPAGLAAAISGSALVAASAAGPAIGIVTFMSTTKSILAGAAILAAIVGVGLALRETRASRALSDSLFSATAANRSLLEQVRTVQQRHPATGAITKTAANSESSRAAWDPAREGDAFLARHPEIRKAVIDQATAVQMARYDGFFYALHLTDSQIAQFLSIMLNLGGSSFPYGPGGQWLTLNPIAGDSLTSEEIDQRLRSLLGDDGFQKFHEYNQTAPARQLTSSVAGALAFTDTPLSPQQASQLSQIMANSRVKITGQRAGLDWDAVLAQAPGVLSEAQLTVLGTVRAEDEAHAAFNRALSANPTN